MSWADWLLLAWSLAVGLPGIHNELSTWKQGRPMRVNADDPAAITTNEGSNQ